MKKKIVVFAGSECSPKREKYYYSLAYKTGKLLAEAGFTVVTGGGPGLMNEVSHGATDGGGKTVGVCLDIAGRTQSKYLSEKFMFTHLGPRQDKLLELGDGFLALPGGIGTLHEVVAVLALKRKNEIPPNKPLIIIDGYYQEFRELLEKMQQEGFITENLYSLFTMVKTPEEAIEKLKRIYEI